MFKQQTLVLMHLKNVYSSCDKHNEFSLQPRHTKMKTCQAKPQNLGINFYK